MNWKKLAVTASAATALLGASSAFASPPNWAPAYGWHAKRHHHHRPKHVLVYRPAPVYYAPPPTVVVPAPVVYGSIPVGPNVRVNFGFRL